MVGKMKRRMMGALLAVSLSVGIGVSASAKDRADVLFERIRTVYQVTEAWHMDGADLDKFVQGAIQGGLEALGDPYTNYYTPDDYDAFLNSLNGTFSGIGAYLELDGSYIVVTSPIKGSPAAQAGLASGDRILEADGVPLIGASTDKAVSVIRGPEGIEVTLKIERPSENRTFTLTIRRSVISIPEVESKMLDGQIGYIQLASFGDDAVQGFYKSVTELKASGAQGLVLDLRQNGGGYLDAAIDIAGAFVPAGEPVVWEVNKGQKTVRNSSGRLINLPMAVLVDNGSASAAEVLAGAIQDYGVAPLVGVKTFGKGTVQQILTLSNNLGGMKVTVAEYLTPKERHVHGAGLIPEYVVENPKPDPERVEPMEFKRILVTTSVGLDVLYLQYRLQDLGYNPDIDGFFGLKTSQAVIHFARDNGLEPRAGVDGKVLEVLNRKVADHYRNQAVKDVQLDKAVELVRSKLK